MSGRKTNGKLQAQDTFSVLGLDREEILQDYRTAFMSRQASVIGRREVLSGKAKFGIFGDGKELPQLAMARVFHPGDWRSGYYRDQTLMLATGMLTLEQFFAQLYAHADVNADPASAGRQMNAHFATRSINPDGTWKDLTVQRNSSADLSPTASQMPRAVGLAYASKLFRQLDGLKAYSTLSNEGAEITFVTIGNASAAEGLFWEALNAIGVLQCPAIISVYDDGYGISVSNESQIAKEDISALISGFRRPPNECCDGYEIYRVKGWDYPALIEVYRQAAAETRLSHLPAIIHIIELTQPFGHSTSGSHERYKTEERLKWEAEWDCIRKFREWILQQGLTSAAELDDMERTDRASVEATRRRAWEAFQNPILADRAELDAILETLSRNSSDPGELDTLRDRLLTNPTPLRRDLSTAARQALVITRSERDHPALSNARHSLVNWRKQLEENTFDEYHHQLYLDGLGSALRVEAVPPKFSVSSPEVYGFEILNAAFDEMFQREPRLIAFGEDVGLLGDVNQGMRGMQEKYGPLRVSDTGIREATIIGQAIGMALRGLRPLAEIQYLDYVLYALQILSDDLATLLWRTKGGQRAPVIVRTRGHRLEGIWHSGSPMAGILNLVRGMHVLVPRNMTQASGFYNTLLFAEEPALLVEVLNGYRLKERLPDNIGEVCVPLGIPEILRQGTDITVVTYGACCRIVIDASIQLAQAGIEAEVIDVQSLLPFDRFGLIVESLKKTGRILFVDEDVPGGTSAYMLQEVIEKGGGYYWLDSPPRTLPASPHRPAYGSDGDYWSKPNPDSVFETVYEMMNETNPAHYPQIFK